MCMCTLLYVYTVTCMYRKKDVGEEETVLVTIITVGVNTARRKSSALNFLGNYNKLCKTFDLYIIYIYSLTFVYGP